MDLNVLIIMLYFSFLRVASNGFLKSAKEWHILLHYLFYFGKLCIFKTLCLIPGFVLCIDMSCDIDGMANLWNVEPVILIRIADKNFIRHLAMVWGHFSSGNFPSTAKREWKQMMMFVGIKLENPWADHFGLIALIFEYQHWCRAFIDNHIIKYSNCYLL